MYLRELFDNENPGPDGAGSDLLDLILMAKSNGLLKIDINTLLKQMMSMGHNLDREGLVSMLNELPAVKETDPTHVFLVGYSDPESSYDEEEIDQQINKLAQKATKRSMK